MIGGNMIAVLQVKVSGAKNKIGERENGWQDVVSLTGWLDFSGGDSKNTVFNAKVQESTHIFICDFRPLSTSVLGENIDVTSENARMIIDGLIYQIKLIDDPMNLHQHLEIYLKYVGGQSG